MSLLTSLFDIYIDRQDMTMAFEKYIKEILTAATPKASV